MGLQRRLLGAADDFRVAVVKGAEFWDENVTPIIKT